MYQLPYTNETASDCDQYRIVCRENVEFIVEMLEAMHVEADLVGDVDSARFWEGVINVIAAFRLRSSPRRGLRPVAR
jgi:hypothetical protein